VLKPSCFSHGSWGARSRLYVGRCEGKTIFGAFLGALLVAAFLVVFLFASEKVDVSFVEEGKFFARTCENLVLRGAFLVAIVLSSLPQKRVRDLMMLSRRVTGVVLMDLYRTFGGHVETGTRAGDAASWTGTGVFVTDRGSIFRWRAPYHGKTQGFRYKSTKAACSPLQRSPGGPV
jgi:hypothetical protein